MIDAEYLLADRSYENNAIAEQMGKQKVKVIIGQCIATKYTKTLSIVE